MNRVERIACGSAGRPAEARRESPSARILGAFVFAAMVIAGANCQVDDDESIEHRSSALTGAGGSPCPLIGSLGSTITPGASPRGYTDSSSVHTVVYINNSSFSISKVTGTPLANPTNLGGSPFANPWGYKRHDGTNLVVYVDENGHVHELGSQDYDFHVSSGINAPIAYTGIGGGGPFPAPEVIPFVKSSNSSALVYRGSNDHVIEVRSNFSGSPPWVATDLTTASSATVTVLKGGAFPFVRSDGHTAVVYIGSDSHIHQLSSAGPQFGWVDTDLSAMSNDTSVVPLSDPWGYKRSDGYNCAVFIGGPGPAKLREIAYIPGSGAGMYELPAFEPRGDLFNRPSGYVRADGGNAVAYTSLSVSGSSSSAHVRQVELRPGGWVDQAFPQTCTHRIGQVFGHTASGTLNSILLARKDGAGAVTRAELSQSGKGSWGLQSF